MSTRTDGISRFLTDPYASRPVGFGGPRQYAVPIPSTSLRVSRVSFSSVASSPPSEASTSSSASRSIYSDASRSRRSSTSSASSAPSIPPWQPPTLNQQLGMAAYDYGYDLPCECTFMDCQIRFHPEYHAEWVAHGISHFIGNLPRKLICTFCPVEFDSGAHGDRSWNYQRRMNHIGEHLQEHRSLQANSTPSFHPKPDFFLLEHLHRIGILDDAHYNELIQYTERPRCEGLQRPGFVSPEQVERQKKEERRSRYHHDQAKEDRDRKKERRHRR